MLLQGIRIERIGAPQQVDIIKAAGSDASRLVPGTAE